MLSDIYVDHFLSILTAEAGLFLFRKLPMLLLLLLLMLLLLLLLHLLLCLCLHLLLLIVPTLPHPPRCPLASLVYVSFC